MPDPLPKDFDAAPLPVLVELLGHDEDHVRSDAACALGDRMRCLEIDGFEPETVERLAALLEDRNGEVRVEAAIALAEAHDRRGTPVLLHAMSLRALRLDAIRALGTMGDPGAIEPLHRLMARWLLPWADRLQAAAALCALGDAFGAEYLESKLQSRRRAERAAAIHFLGESRHPRARTILEGILASRDDTMRDVAARALGLLDDPDARAALESAREGADDELRADIDTAMKRLSQASQRRV